MRRNKLYEIRRLNDNDNVISQPDSIVGNEHRYYVKALFVHLLYRLGVVTTPAMAGTAINELVQGYNGHTMLPAYIARSSAAVG